MRQLFNEFITALREKPFSYKIAYCLEMGETDVDPARLRALYDETEYLMGRVVICDAVRRLNLRVPNTFLRHMVETGNRYVLKNLLLMLRERQSLRTLVRTVKQPLCQDDSLIRYLTVEAARAQGFEPQMLDIYINTEQEEMSAEEREAWKLWRPLDALIQIINENQGEAPDTLRLMLWENRPLLAEELAHDLSDIFNVPSAEVRHINRRRLVGLLAKYIDLSYLVCKALAENEFDVLSDRLAQEDQTMPPGVLMPAPELTGERGAAMPEGDEEVFPEEALLGQGGGTLPEMKASDLTLDDLVFEPEWAMWVPHGLAEELLIIPLHIEGSPPHRILLGCAHPDPSAALARLKNLGCEIICTQLPEDVVREAIRRFY